jgi:hypothetical protein
MYKTLDEEDNGKLDFWNRVESYVAGPYTTVDSQMLPFLLSIQFGKKEMRILMVGLDAAGKTTILYKLKLGEGEFISAFSHNGDESLLAVEALDFSKNVQILILCSLLTFHYSCNNHSHHW